MYEKFFLFTVLKRGIDYGKVCMDKFRVIYDGVINGQGVVVKLSDFVVNFNIYIFFVLLDGWGGIIFYFVIQDCIIIKRFNLVGRVIIFEDWRFWEIIKDKYN